LRTTATTAPLDHVRDHGYRPDAEAPGRLLAALESRLTPVPAPLRVPVSFRVLMRGVAPSPELFAALRVVLPDADQPDRPVLLHEPQEEARRLPPRAFEPRVVMQKLARVALRHLHEARLPLEVGDAEPG